MEDKQMVKNDDSAIVDIITTSLKVPGVRVDRNAFLKEIFKGVDSERLELILAKGPVEAGCDQSTLKKLAKGLVNKRTLESSGISFAAGLPGGPAMAGTIPADILQFYGFALRLAQEIAYIYGLEDLGAVENEDSEKVMNIFIVYLGVMLGASGANALLKAMSSALAKQALKKLPQKALTKIAVFRMIASIAKFFGVNMTKSVFAKAVAKAIPVVGGVASGSITLVTMRPMGMRLVTCLDEAKFEYTEEDYENDIKEIQEILEAEEIAENEESEAVVEA